MEVVIHMKTWNILILCFLVITTFGCNKKAEQKKNTKPEDVAEIILDRNRQQTTIETREGRVVRDSR